MRDFGRVHVVVVLLLEVEGAEGDAVAVERDEDIIAIFADTFM